MEGDFSRNLAELRSALEPRPRAARRTYELVDLFVDVAKDLRVLREAAKFDTSLKRVARSLASVLAHPRTGLSIRQLSRSLETSRHEARAARHHAEVKFAGAVVEKSVSTRVIKSEEVAINLAGHRLSHDVCRVREASMRNAMSKAILERTMPISKLYELYEKQCDANNITKKDRYGRESYRKFLRAEAYTEPSEESACCEICLEFIDETCDSIKKLIEEACLGLPGGEKMKQLTRMLKAVRASLKTGVLASHQSQGHDGSLMHDTYYALSDPHEPRLAEDCDHAMEMDCTLCNGQFYLRDEIAAVIDWLDTNTDTEKERITEFRSNLLTYFGMTGLLRGTGHLIRDRRQSQFRIDAVKELSGQYHRFFFSDDYCSKLEREKHRMGKSEGYGGAKVSLHGTLIIMAIPPPDTAGVKWENMPKGAQEGAAELQGKFLHVFLQIYCDDSTQDAWHAVNVHAVRDMIIHSLFPHLTEGFSDCDNGPHYQNVAKVLTLVENLERHGIKIVVSCSCEPGEGKWFVDAKFAHVKRHHRRNARFDLGDAVCADSYGRSAVMLGGESPSIVAVLDAASLRRDLQLKTPPGGIKDISHLRVKQPTPSGGLLLFRSWRIGSGIEMTAAQVAAAWKGAKWPEPEPVFTMPKTGEAVAVNAKVKGTFEDERNARTEKASSRTQKAALQEAKRAEKRAKLEEFLSGMQTAVRCDVCWIPVSTDGFDTAEAAMQTHRATGCLGALPGRHRFPCVSCNRPGHMTPAAKACTDAGRASWTSMTPDARAELLHRKKEEWRASYKPREKLKVEISAADLGNEFTEERKWCQTSKRGSGGFDSVVVHLNATSILHLSLVSPSADAPEWPRVRITRGSSTANALIIRDGFSLVSINEAVTSPASVLPVVSDGATVKLTFSRPNPPKLPQGWAIQQPDLQRPPMSSEQALWLYRMIKLPGKLPPDHMFRKMEMHFRERPNLIMHPRRIKTFVSRVVGMLKKNALTKQIALVRSALEAAEGNYDQALSSLGDSPADDDGNADGDDRDDDADSSEDSESGEGDEEVDPAPAPRGGFVHAGAVGAGRQLTVGSRLQYRFEDGWLVCEIHKVIPGVSGCRYDLHCENQQIVLGAWLRACEHGTEKQWVLWQADSSIAGDSAYAVASVGDDERVVSAPAAGSDIMGAYVKERLANKKKEHVYINFLSPYDWVRGRIEKVMKSKKDTIKVKFDECPSAARGWTCNALINPAQYGTRGRWFFTEHAASGP